MGSNRRNEKQSRILAILAIGFFLWAVGCSPSESNRLPESVESPQATPTPADPWSALLQTMPHPYLLPLPTPRRTSLDGTYNKVELKETPPVHCLRCPDYAPEGGIWKLNLDKGTFRIIHEMTGWKSIGSYVVTRDRWTSGAPDQLLLFNDPTCPDAIGLYTWRLDEGNLILEAIDDTCAIYLRAMNLTNLPWMSCQPPNIEAGITDHWPKPPGCD
jgi:hypothetical protein